MAKSRANGPTTQAVTVGTTRKGSFGRRVGGVAGREASGGRTGLTDAAVSAGSKAHGRSAPSTGGGYGGSGGTGGGGVVETTTHPGGIADWTGYTDPGDVVPPSTPEEWVPEPSVTPVYKNPAPVAIAPTPRTTYTPPTTTTRTTAPTTTRTTAPTTAPTSKPFVTPIGGQYAPTPAKPAGPTVNPYTGFTTSPKPATTAYKGIPYTAPKPVVKGQPAPAAKPAAKPKPTAVATTTRRVAQ